MITVDNASVAYSPQNINKGDKNMSNFTKKDLMRRIVKALEAASIWQLRLVLVFVQEFIKQEE